MAKATFKRKNLLRAHCCRGLEFMITMAGAGQQAGRHGFRGVVESLCVETTAMRKQRELPGNGMGF